MVTSKVLSELYQEGLFTWEVGLTCFITFLVVLRTVLILSQPRTLTAHVFPLKSTQIIVHGILHREKNW